MWLREMLEVQLCTLKITKSFFWNDSALLNMVFLEHFMHVFFFCFFVDLSM